MILIDRYPHYIWCKDHAQQLVLGDPSSRSNHSHVVGFISGVASYLTIGLLLIDSRRDWPCCNWIWARDFKQADFLSGPLGYGLKVNNVGCMIFAINHLINVPIPFWLSYTKDTKQLHCSWRRWVKNKLCPLLPPSQKKWIASPKMLCVCRG